MRKRLALILSIIMIYSFTCGFAKEPDTSAHAHSIVDVQTGRVLASKDGDKQMSMASTTKVMTALLAVESGKLDEVVTIPKEASGVEGSS